MVGLSRRPSQGRDTEFPIEVYMRPGHGANSRVETEEEGRFEAVYDGRILA